MYDRQGPSAHKLMEWRALMDRVEKAIENFKPFVNGSTGESWRDRAAYSYLCQLKREMVRAEQSDDWELAELIIEDSPLRLPPE